MIPRRLARLATTLAAMAGCSNAGGIAPTPPEDRSTFLALPPPTSDGLYFLDSKESTTPHSATDAVCPDDMVEVEGRYCPWLEQHCLQWLPRGEDEPQLRCAEFRKSGACLMPQKHVHFCVDRYEWPNREGALPAISMTWYEAKATCTSIGKRLCDDDEWTVACEGPERTPYPYGYMRDPHVCNTDRHWFRPDNQLYVYPPTRAAETARLDQRERSGARPSCVSSFGVYDMTGNVDEWVKNETQQCKPYCSGLKGGAWTPVRNRCRPMTTGHEEKFSYYQVGFRCCSDVPRP
jgi:hypothetical protein